MRSRFKPDTYLAQALRNVEAACKATGRIYLPCPCSLTELTSLFVCT